MATARGLAVGAATLLAVTVAGCSAAPPPRPGPWQQVAEPSVAAPADPGRAYAEDRVAAMTLREKIAAMLMIRVGGTSPEAIKNALESTGAAGVIMMGDNVPGSAAALRAIVEQLPVDAGLPPLTAIDQEGGIVRRLPGDDAPAAPLLRRSSPEASRAAFAERAELVAAAGVDINFGIVADVTADPASFIFSRTLGDDAEQAAARVAAAVEGERDAVLSTLKHFPGHGAVRGDSHVGVPETGMPYDRWRATQAPPFVAGIDAGAELVMVGHLRYTAVDDAPATLSAEWHRILRDELGFDGIVVTDDMSMLQRSGLAEYADPVRNAVAAVAAGNDLVLFVGPVDVPAVTAAVAAAVADGRIAEESIDESVLRLIEVRRTLSGRTGPFIDCGEVCRAAAS